MMGALLMVMGGSSTLLSFLDWALDAKSKNWISEKVLSFWNWLDDLKNVSLLAYLRNKIILLVLSIILTSILSAAYVWLIEQTLPGMASDRDVPVSSARKVVYTLLLFAVLLGFLAGFFLVRRVTNYASHKDVLRASLFLLLIAATIAACNFLFSKAIISMNSEGVLSWVVPICEIVWGIMSIAVFYVVTLVLLPYVLIFFVMAVFFVLEMIIRKMAEAPNGVLLGFGAFLGSLGVFIKSFYHV